MTFRLVALMSVVLLLSLAAFGLVMSMYQDQVMEEVARTASAVGKATLRTLEVADSAGPGTEPAFAFESIAETEGSGQATRAEAERVVMIKSFDMQHQEGGESLFEHEWIEVPSGTCLNEISRGSGSEVTSVITCDQFVEEPSGSQAYSVVTGEKRQIFISVEDVTAEPDTDDNRLILKIPRFVRPVQEDVFIHEITTAGGAVHEADGDGEGELMLAKHDELKLPIPVQDYDELFDRVRSRSLFWFLGVFLVGTVISTGVATRFTRPIRKLDAGIRKISGGDLDVEVEVQGYGEIARLGHTFNGMTRRLRENQERSREMVRREKLSALGGLAAGVAHDVRNPLHSIGLALQHMQETCRPETEERRVEFDGSLKLIRGEIGRLDQLVDNFLRFARSKTSCASGAGTEGGGRRSISRTCYGKR